MLYRLKEENQCRRDCWCFAFSALPSVAEEQEGEIIIIGGRGTSYIFLRALKTATAIF
jgi:hypothetical protein